jgi:hypothetical protein
MKRLAMVIATLGLLLAPSAALASSSTCQQYSSQDCSASTVASQLSSTVSTSTATTSASTLPFTGLDVVLLAAGGGTLLGAGLIVRRLSRGLNQ